MKLEDQVQVQVRRMDKVLVLYLLGRRRWRTDRRVIADRMPLRLLTDTHTHKYTQTRSNA
jgi:hypothetical protein